MKRWLLCTVHTHKSKNNFWASVFILPTKSKSRRSHCPFQSSLTTLVVEGRQRNLSQKVCCQLLFSSIRRPGYCAEPDSSVNTQSNSWYATNLRGNQRFDTLPQVPIITYWIWNIQIWRLFIDPLSVHSSSKLRNNNYYKNNPVIYHRQYFIALIAGGAERPETNNSN